jgi:hypothetical protein
MDLNHVKDIATILGTFVAMITLIKAYIEYAKQNTQKRAEYFLGCRNRIFNDKDFNKVCEALDYKPETVKLLSIAEKETFLGYMEETAFLMYSGLINTHTVHYMFGYYAILCWKNDDFWTKPKRDDPYWSVFKRFAEEMIVIDNEKTFIVNKVHL